VLPAPIDIVAFDISSGELLIGKATTKSATIALVEVGGIDNDMRCTGFSEVKKHVPGGAGSIGYGELVCRDGRKIIGEFVYESARSGHGSGVDSARRVYRFIFGDLNVNPDALRAKFREMLEREQSADRST
jgi:hypothetical protein